MSEQTNWERGVLEKLALSAIQEQKRARRWVYWVDWAE